VDPAGAASAYVSFDGLEWLKLAPSIRIAVEPVYAALKGGGRSLSSFLPAAAAPEPEADPLPGADALATPFPNPFNPQVTIPFDLARRSPVTIGVYEAMGRMVRLVDRSERPAGRHFVVWDGIDAHGRKVASGTYFVRMEAGATQFQRSIVLLK